MYNLCFKYNCELISIKVLKVIGVTHFQTRDLSRKLPTPFGLDLALFRLNSEQNFVE